LIVADENFGSGSSREHAPLALMGCGVSCVIAKSFARIYFRNSINLGFPAVECSVEASEGDEVEVDFAKGVVRNLAKKKEFKFNPLPEFLVKLMESGGLVEYVKKELKKK
jgi:3-isopropylmalate/(R)-2-methylmalate dehydratase small subunit